MRKSVWTWVLCVLCGLWAGCDAQTKENEISVSSKGGGFPLAEASVVYDQADGKTVKKVAELFAGDIRRVTGKDAEMQADMPESGVVVLLGTADGNQWIRQLAENGKIDVSPLKGSTERFMLKQVKNPFPGVDEALVIAGSDRRGVAYGAFTLSEEMGVSPFYWWADVPVKRMDKVMVKADYVSAPPSVKFRGIFLNDEGWGLNPWAAKTYEKELGNIGPKTYTKICELVLRLKGNMLAPAMHGCSDPFYFHPENKVVADEYGILITTSHCEPLLFNNASNKEWDTKKDGPWDYSKNSETILKKLDDRVREASPYENVYTLAMRGLHDAGMQGDLTEDEKVQMLQKAITDQRGILSKYVQKPLADIPQIFRGGRLELRMPCKERQDVPLIFLHGKGAGGVDQEAARSQHPRSGLQKPSLHRDVFLRPSLLESPDQGRIPAEHSLPGAGGVDEHLVKLFREFQQQLLGTLTGHKQIGNACHLQIFQQGLRPGMADVIGVEHPPPGKPCPQLRRLPPRRST